MFNKRKIKAQLHPNVCLSATGGVMTSAGRRIVSLAIPAIAASCTVYTRPLIESSHENPSRPHPVGIVQFMEEKPDLSYRLIAVHGVGEHAPDFADAWLANFAKAAQLTSTGGQPATAYDMGMASNQLVPESMRPVLKKYGFVRSRNDSRTTLEAYALTWSPLTKPYKDDLIQDETPPKYLRKHARLNADLKFDLLDDRLLDAVMYAGAYKATLKQALSQALCRIIRDDGQSPVAAGPECLWSAISAETARQRRLVFFTHSLGGRMIFDVLADLLTDETSAAYGARRNGFQVYLFANQISLLELTDHAAPFQRTQGNAVVRFSQALKLSAAQHQDRARGQFVAFSDPNDVLSYQLPEHILSELGTTGLAVNVTISNAPTWFGIIEDPGAAHDGYLEKDSIWQAVASGNYH